MVVYRDVIWRQSQSALKKYSTRRICITEFEVQHMLVNIYTKQVFQSYCLLVVMLFMWMQGNCIRTFRWMSIRVRHSFVNFMLKVESGQLKLDHSCLENTMSPENWYQQQMTSY